MKVTGKRKFNILFISTINNSETIAKCLPHNYLPKEYLLESVDDEEVGYKGIVLTFNEQRKVFNIFKKDAVIYNIDNIIKENHELDLNEFTKHTSENIHNDIMKIVNETKKDMDNEWYKTLRSS